MQNGSTNQLHIIVYHVPGNLAATRGPAIFEYGLIAIDGNIIFGNTEVPVKLRSCRYDLGIFLKAPGSFLYHGKSLRKQFFQYFLELLVSVLFQLVNFLVNGVFAYQVVKGKFFRPPVRVLDLRIDFLYVVLDTLAEL